MCFASCERIAQPLRRGGVRIRVSLNGQLDCEHFRRAAVALGLPFTDAEVSANETSEPADEEAEKEAQKKIKKKNKTTTNKETKNKETNDRETEKK